MRFIILNSFQVVLHHFYCVSRYFLMINMLVWFSYYSYISYLFICYVSLMLSPFIGKVCYFTIYFIVQCYISLLETCCVWAMCIITACFYTTVALHVSFHADCLCVMAGLSNSNVCPQSALLCPLLCLLFCL